MSDHSPMPGIDEGRIWDIINQEWQDLSAIEKHFWEFIKIIPEKWLSDPYQYRPKTAWVVAIIGQHVIWYNECWFGDHLDGLDTGFSCAHYQAHGQIGCSFSVDDMPLKDAVRSMLSRVHPL